MVKPIPDGYHAVTPYLVVRDAEAIIEFLRQGFGAELAFEPLRRPDGKILHAEIKVGDARVMVADESEQHQAMTSMLYVYVPDVDATYRRALAAGGHSIGEPRNQFFGDRTASVTDPAGNQWEIATRKEDVSPAELQHRADKLLKQGKAA